MLLRIVTVPSIEGLAQLCILPLLWQLLPAVLGMPPSCWHPSECHKRIALPCHFMDIVFAFRWPVSVAQFSANFQTVSQRASVCLFTVMCSKQR